jgi:PAS domain S-box-containing protein
VPRPLRLLIVEDSKNDADLLLRTLRTGGYEPAYQVVDSAAAMRAALEVQEWDVITSDHSMPQFSGPAALELALELCPNVPFIIVSGEIGLNLGVSLIKGGAEDYVQKDELVRLVPVIERVLDDVEDRCKQQSWEQALQVSETRYRRLFETAQDGILIVNADTGQIDDVNPFLLNLVGYSREEYLGKKLWEVGVFKDSEASKAAFLELERKSYIRFEDIPLRTKSGGCVDVEFISNVYLVENQRVIQCNIRDISERREAEMAIRNLNADLEQRVHARTVQVEDLNKELETFNYSVSHDLRAPLRRIAGLVKALEEDCAGKMDSQGKRLIQDIQASTLHMTGLIQALLKLASFSTGKLQWNSTDLTSMAHVIATELKQSDPGRHVEFVVGEDVTAAGDATLLRVVMENLLGNAWKFTSHRDSARIEFGVAPQTNKGAVYFVRDNGAGFDMKYADRLFGAFQRLHAESEFPGTGIGLASVQRIVFRHGGHIWAESSGRQGATFYFTLEAFPKHGAALPSRHAAESKLAGGPADTDLSPRVPLDKSKTVVMA